MARFRKSLVPLGVHVSPDGEVHATPERVRRWASTFRKMRDAGIKVPVAWGHQPGAIPLEDEASYQLSISKFNAGYATDMGVDPDTGELFFEGECPGVEVDENGNLVSWTRLPDGREVKAAIAEVSAGINNWKDGRGKIWRDAVVHIALTPLPVCAGQKGFQALSTRRRPQVPWRTPDGTGKLLGRPVALSTLSVAAATVPAGGLFYRSRLLPAGYRLSLLQLNELGRRADDGDYGARTLLVRLGWVPAGYSRTGTAKWQGINDEYGQDAGKKPRYGNRPGVKPRIRGLVAQNAPVAPEHVHEHIDQAGQIEGHRIVPGSNEEASTRRAYKTLRTHHGPVGALHRIKELAKTDLDQLNQARDLAVTGKTDAIKKAAENNIAKFSKRLNGYRVMLKLHAEREGVTPQQAAVEANKPAPAPEVKQPEAPPVAPPEQASPPAPAGAPVQPPALGEEKKSALKEKLKGKRGIKPPTPALPEPAGQEQPAAPEPAPSAEAPAPPPAGAPPEAPATPEPRVKLKPSETLMDHADEVLGEKAPEKFSDEGPEPSKEEDTEVGKSDLYGPANHFLETLRDDAEELSKKHGKADSPAGITGFKAKPGGVGIKQAGVDILDTLRTHGAKEARTKFHDVVKKGGLENWQIRKLVDNINNGLARNPVKEIKDLKPGEELEPLAKPEEEAPESDPAKMTASEYLDWFKKRPGYNKNAHPDEDLRASHRQAVAAAVGEGAPVPEHVLGEYPDLKKQVGERATKKAGLEALRDQIRAEAGKRRPKTPAPPPPEPAVGPEAAGEPQAVPPPPPEPAPAPPEEKPEKGGKKPEEHALEAAESMLRAGEHQGGQIDIHDLRERLARKGISREAADEAILDLWRSGKYRPLEANEPDKYKSTLERDLGGQKQHFGSIEPKPPEPLFTGTDELGRKFENGWYVGHAEQPAPPVPEMEEGTTNELTGEWEPAAPKPEEPEAKPEQAALSPPAAPETPPEVARATAGEPPAVAPPAKPARKQRVPKAKPTAADLAEGVPHASGGMSPAKAEALRAAARKASASLTVKDFREWAKGRGIPLVGNGWTKAGALTGFLASIDRMEKAEEAGAKPPTPGAKPEEKPAPVAGPARSRPSAQEQKQRATVTADLQEALKDMAFGSEAGTAELRQALASFYGLPAFPHDPIALKEMDSGEPGARYGGKYIQVSKETIQRAQGALAKPASKWSFDEKYAVKHLVHEMTHSLEPRATTDELRWLTTDEGKRFGYVDGVRNPWSGQVGQSSVRHLLTEGSVDFLTDELLRAQGVKGHIEGYQGYVDALRGLATAAGITPMELAKKLFATGDPRKNMEYIGSLLGAAPGKQLEAAHAWATQVLQGAGEHGSRRSNGTAEDYADVVAAVKRKYGAENSPPGAAPGAKPEETPAAPAGEPDYSAAAAALGKGVAGVADLRKHFPGLTDEQFGAALARLADAGKVVLAADDHRDAVLRKGGVLVEGTPISTVSVADSRDKVTPEDLEKAFQAGTHPTEEEPPEERPAAGRYQPATMKIGDKEVQGIGDGGLFAREEEDGWKISHQPSGLLLDRRPLPSREAAMAAMDRLNKLTDWKQGDREIRHQKGLGRAVLDTLREAHYAVPENQSAAGENPPPVAFRPEQVDDVAQAIEHAGLIRGLPNSQVGIGGGDGLAPVDVIHQQFAKRGVHLNAAQMRVLVNHLVDAGAVEAHLVNEQDRLTPEARAMGVPKDPGDPDSPVQTLLRVKDAAKLKEALANFAGVQTADENSPPAGAEGGKLEQGEAEPGPEATGVNREDVEGEGAGGPEGGLRPGQPVGGDAGEAPAEAVPEPGDGTPERAGVRELPDRDDQQRAEPGGPPGEAGDTAGGGGGTGEGATAPEAAGGGGLPAAVGGGGGAAERSGGSAPLPEQPTHQEESLAEPPTPENPTDLSAGNFRYTSRDFARGGLKSKFKANIEAIKTLKTIQAEGRTEATPAEQAVLSRFVGWGQFPALFNSYWDTEWQKERQQLQSLLTPEEWDAARASTTNAHYTHPEIVEAHWKMAERLGFKGGRFLETSAGIGYYLGMMPAEVAGRTHASAVELDPTTGGMASLLYPRANVSVQGFEKYQAPDNFYDLVASNVPFDKNGPYDPRYAKHQASLHDYFFLKSADLCRPGGLIMHITSTWTMDKQNSAIRKELAKSCDLVAAIRFPGGAHKENAGTHVVTDMLILRKRMPGEAPSGDQDWMELTTVPDPAGGEPIPVNRYFANHPEQILGTLDRTGTGHEKNEMNVSRTDDYEQRLAAAIGRLPEGLMKPARAPAKRFSPEVMPAPGDVKVGGYKVKDGKVYVREGGALVEKQDIPAATLKRLQGQLEIRDAYRAVVNDELAKRDATASRAKLNAAYDAFVKKNGPLSDNANKRAMRGDPDAPVLLSLEKYDPKTKKAAKEAIFTKATVRPENKVERVNTVGEGLSVSLHEHGRLDVDHIAKLTGKPKEQVQAELVESGVAYNDPSEGWKPADQYLSGNVRRKLALARAAAKADPKFQANVEALEKVQPEDIDHTEIGVRLGSPWVPASDVAEFAASLLQGRKEAFDIHYIPARGEWLADFNKHQGAYLGRSQQARDVWGVKDSSGVQRVFFEDVLEAALNNTPIIVRDKIDEKTSVVNTQVTDDANAKVAEMKEKFKDWIWSDDDRRRRLHRHYNDNFNNIRPIEYDGSHQQFPGMNPGVTLRPHQKNFVWQVVTTGKGLAAHEVGTGKSYSMIAAAMELRRLGLARKPCIACLKANVEAITNDALHLYPGAKILSTADMFDAKKRKETISRIATGDYDMVIMTHDHLGLLQMRPETVKAYIGEELKELEAAIVAAQKDNPKKDNRIVKRLEKSKKRLEAQLEKALDASKKDNAVFFEDCGIDHLFVDEAHKFKSLPCHSQMQGLKGVPTSRSDKATAMLMRTRWLQQQNGGRGVVFATGTPVANTMPELYNMQRYVQPDDLKERGLEAFDAWAQTFGNVVSNMEFTVTGEYKPVSRFAEFANVPELMQVAKQMMDVKRADRMTDENGKPTLVRPRRKDSVISSPKSEAMDKLMDELKARAAALKNRGKAQPGDDNMLVICTDGRKGAIDMRLLDPSAPDDPNSKVNQCIRKVLEISKARPGVTQLIFSDIGVSPSKKGEALPEIQWSDDEDDDEGTKGDKDASEEAAEEGGGPKKVAKKAEKEVSAPGGFHLYKDVIDKLVKGGIPREKIADFSKLKGKKKEEAMEAMRNGDILVGIGSTDKLGTGVNVQDKLAALHHIDVPWLPAAIEQRDGRGWRQENMNDPTKPADQQNVDIFRYVAEGSLDQMFWQLIAKKAHFINQTINANPESLGRNAKEIDTEQVSPEELMAYASGDPRILEKVNLDEDIKRLKAAQGRHEREQAGLRDSIRLMEQHRIPAWEREAKSLHHVAGIVAANEEPRFIPDPLHAHEAEKAGMSRGGGLASDNDFAQAFKDFVSAREARADYEQRIGTYRGLTVLQHGSKIALQNPDARDYTEDKYPTGASLGSMEYVARHLKDKAEEADRDVEKARKDLEHVKAQVGKPFPKADELKQKLARHAELETALAKVNLPSGHKEGDEVTLADGRRVKLTGFDADKGEGGLYTAEHEGKPITLAPDLVPPKRKPKEPPAGGIKMNTLRLSTAARYRSRTLPAGYGLRLPQLLTLAERANGGDLEAADILSKLGFVRA